MSYKIELAVALDAIRLASKLCRNVQNDLKNSSIKKSDRSPVTVADYASQALIVRHLHSVFPNDPIVGEENSDTLRGPQATPLVARICKEMKLLKLDDPEFCNPNLWLNAIDQGSHREYSTRFWALDPIDGTRGFLRGEQYALALALIVNGRVVVAVLGCPNLDLAETEPAQPIGHPPSQGSLLGAIHQQGCFLYPWQFEKVEGITQARTSCQANICQAIVCESVEAAHSDHSVTEQMAKNLEINASPLRMDSQAKYAAVACGRADLYLRSTTQLNYIEKIWDHAAGSLVVEESGGHVTDLFGQPLNFSTGWQLSANRGVLASNGPLHETVQSYLDTRSQNE